MSLGYDGDWYDPWENTRVERPEEGTHLEDVTCTGCVYCKPKED